jgi:putative pyruvate formate lyase activating enzyme
MPKDPSYLRLYREGKLQERALQAVEQLRDCAICPRECHVDRLSGERGVCETGRKAIVSSFNAHFGEEAPLVGSSGSGTIFFSACNLLCTFCQNYEISHLREGVEVEPVQLAAMMLRLAKSGCHNINFVTPTHVVPQILEGLVVAVENGLQVPLVYNSGGYDRVETLRILDGVFDIYMPDFKFWDADTAMKFCSAPDYREIAKAAIREMHRQVGDLEMDGKGVALKGLLVRHLVMPNDVAHSAEVLRFLAKEISPDTYVNVMDQYRPCGKASKDPSINRRITAEEFERAMDWARQAGLTRLDSRQRARRILFF